MKKSELKEAIKNEITSVLLEGMSDEERENRIQHLMRTGAKEKPLRKLAAIGKKEDEKDLNEGKKGVVVDPDEIMMHINQYQSGNIDGDDLAQAIEEILVAMMNTPLREEDEPTDAEIKKADSVASAANKLQKLVKKMKDKAKDFKAAEGKAKEKIKDELKAMTAEKKKLEKSL